MPNVGVKLYSVVFKLLLKHRLQSLLRIWPEEAVASGDPFGVTSRPEESTAPANPSFSGDGVATKDIHIDPLTSLSLRVFLPDSPLLHHPQRRHSYDSPTAEPAAYGGYLPSAARGDARRRSRRLPVMIQFHGGGFITGSNTSTANDLFCRRIAKLCDVIVIAVGYRLAPESRYPAAFEDGLKVLNWLGRQANLAAMGSVRSGGIIEGRRSNIVDTFGAASVEPWLAAHGDPSR